MIVDWFDVGSVMLVATGLCVGVVFGGEEAAVDNAKVKTVSVLTIGNSFSENVLHQLPRIVEASGNKMVYAKANLGGCSLKRHWNHMTSYMKDTADPAGKPYGGGRFSLKDMLTRQQWDVVTMQQVSYLSHDLETYEPYAADLHAYIREHAPQAKIYIHQVWAYRVDDPRFAPKNKAVGPHTHKEMYEQVRQANHTIAEKLNIDILPSGDAMYLADIDAEWGYKPDLSFDIKSAVYPTLPDQVHSLHSGRFWRKQKDGSQKLFMDGHHASPNGEYLAAGVWFEILFGKSVLKNSYIPKGMDKDYATFLRQTAHNAVAAQSTQQK